ncbi:unknown protein [Microcystis aeruginosa NIES-87]|jgi:hypothetical protein|nr:unknown protein [Microcystis aeruginosa NIES-87]
MRQTLSQSPKFKWDLLAIKIFPLKGFHGESGRALTVIVAIYFKKPEKTSRLSHKSPREVKQVSSLTFVCYLGPSS